MEKQKKSANIAAYVDSYFRWQGDPTTEGVTAKQLPNGKWLCELNLPVIDKIVKSTSKTATNAMANASKKAAILIDQYSLDHPETHIMSKSYFHHFVFYVDEHGQTGFRRSPEYLEKQDKKRLKESQDCSKAFEKAVSSIPKIKGTNKDLFVQIIDKSWFGEDDSIEDMQRKISRKMLGDTSDWYISWVSTTISGNSVIAIGYILED